MKNLISIISILLISTVSFAQSSAPINYGANDSVGSYIQLNGINLYYEVYGEGEPLLIIHGNGGSISSLSAQINYFSENYHVIAPDSRGQGKSELGQGQLSYDQISEDMIALLNALSIDKANILGWSDGGIIGLIMGIKYPERTGKIVVMGANTQPSTITVLPDFVTNMEERVDLANEKIQHNDLSAEWEVQKQLNVMMLTQPNISNKDLQSIVSPVLVMAGDRDLIRNEHTLEIFENLPNAHLALVPNETHMLPLTNPKLFNSMVDSFLRSEFTRRDTATVLEGLPSE